MNFDLGPDEIALRDGIRGLCAGRFPMDRLHEMDRLRDEFDPSLWKELGEAGVFSLRQAEADGGVGMGMTEAVIVFEELGRALVPGPLVATHLAAGLIEGAADGSTPVALAMGDPLYVEHLGFCDQVLVLGEDVQRWNKAIDGAVEWEPVAPLDPLSSLYRVWHPLVGRPIDADAGRLRLEGAALTAALSSGIASRTTELAVAYAKERHQFDKPIGSFQAVKHMCADMLVRAEVARAAVDAAGVLLDDQDVDATTAVATAKLLASEYAIQNAKTCIQVHGGMGFTWEVDAHLFLKRAAVLATQFGGMDSQAEMVAASL